MLMLEEYERGGFDAFLNDFGKPSTSTVEEPTIKVRTIEKDKTTGKYF